MHEVCNDVAFASFSSYFHNDDFAKLNTAHVSLFERFLTALFGSVSRCGVTAPAKLEGRIVEAGTWAYQDWLFYRTWSATLSITIGELAAVDT
jgi:hypothetical protein